MTDTHQPQPLPPHDRDPNIAGIESPLLVAEAVPAAPMSIWQRIRFLFKVVEIRLRFILILAVTFVLIGKWDTVKNVWDKWTRSAAIADHEHSDKEYFCPMHPSVVRDGLEADGSVPKCPICGMPLSLHKKGAHVDLPGGVTAHVQLSPERIQMANISTAEVEYRPLVKEIRTVGSVDYDESRRSRVVTRVAGYVEKLYVDKTFMSVSKGERLAVLYSPDLYADILLLLSRDSGEMVETSKQRLRLMGINDNEIDELVAMRELLVALNRGDKNKTDQAVEKLRKLGMTDAEIDDLKTTRRAPTTLAIRAPANGLVINKENVQGAKVDAGKTLFDLADLSHVWIEADVFESDMGLLQKGQEVETTVEGLPNQVFHGQILLVHPHLEAATRTNRIRIDLPNPEHALRPGMFATVTIKVPLHAIEPYKSVLAAAQAGPQGTDDISLIAFQKTCPVTGNKLGSMGPPVKQLVGDKAVFLCCPACVKEFKEGEDDFLHRLAPPPQGAVLTVPEQAVIDTGSKKVVYIEREPGVFDGVEVQLGPESGGFFPVVKGLRAGDRVASAGAFLIDADSKLNPAVGATYMGTSGGPTTVAHGTPSVAPKPAKEDEKTEALQHGTSIVKPEPIVLTKPSAKDLKNLNKLPAADRAAALAQQICPITDAALGSMGVPVKVDLGSGKTAFICCPGCRDEATKEPQKTIEKLARIERAVKERAQKK